MAASECLPYVCEVKDGMCCGTGAGSYEVTLGGNGCSPLPDEDWERRKHHFTAEGDNKEGRRRRIPAVGMEHYVV